jgi:hypothetical protein
MEKRTVPVISFKNGSAWIWIGYGLSESGSETLAYLFSLCSTYLYVIPRWAKTNKYRKCKKRKITTNGGKITRGFSLSTIFPDSFRTSQGMAKVLISKYG